MDLNYTKFINFTSFYPYYFYGILGTTTPLFALELYIIFSQTPKEMKNITWFLLNTSTTNFLIVLMYTLIQYVPIFYPINSGLSKDLFGLFGIDGTLIGFVINSILILNLIFSYTTTMCYQYATFKGRGWLAEFILNKKRFGLFYLVFMGPTSVALIVFIRMARSSYMDRNAFFESTNNTKIIRFVKEMFDDQQSAISVSSHTNVWINLFTVVVTIQIAIEIILVIIFNILLIKTIKSTSKLVTKKTLLMQLTFYRSALIESLFVLTFILIPTFIAPSMVIGITDLRVGIIVYNMPIISAPLSYILKMALTRPYRMFFVKLITKKSASTVENTTGPPIPAIKNNFVKL